MYSVVKTNEKGVPFITAVPSTWVKNTTLYWPRCGKAVLKLRKDSRSIPGSDWKCMKCVVKEDSIPTFQKAKAVQDALLNVGTESEGEVLQKFQTKKSKKNPASDYNFMIREAVRQGKDASAKPNSDLNKIVALTQKELPSEENGSKRKFIAAQESEEVLSFEFEELMDVQPTQKRPRIEENTTPTENSSIGEEEHLTESDESDEADGDSSQSLFNMDSTEMEDSEPSTQTLGQQLLKLERWLQIVVKYLVKQDAKYNEILSILNMLKSYIVKTPPEQQLSDTEIKKSFPVATFQELMNLEEKLKNDVFRGQVKKHFGKICGVNGEPKCKSVAYFFVDNFFTREIFVEFSWTGYSKAKNKKEFRKFTNVIKTFFEIIHQADENYSALSNEAFFKNVLKYSKQRLSNKKP